MRVPLLPALALLAACRGCGDPTDLPNDTQIETDVAVDSEDTEPVVESDTLLPPDSEPAETDDTVITVPPTPIRELGPGAVIVSEFLAQPWRCGKRQGEFVELLNTTDVTIRLDGLQVAAENREKVVHPLGILGPGERYLITYDIFGFRLCYAGEVADLAAPWFLDETGDDVKVWLVDGDTEIVYDEVAFGPTTELVVANGRSWERDDDDPNVWCLAEEPDDLTAQQDQATAGHDNGSCPPPGP